jgi:hypothetical protein
MFLTINTENFISKSLTNSKKARAFVPDKHLSLKLASKEPTQVEELSGAPLCVIQLAGGPTRKYVSRA